MIYFILSLQKQENRRLSLSTDSEAESDCSKTMNGYKKGEENWESPILGGKKLWEEKKVNHVDGKCQEKE